MAGLFLGLGTLLSLASWVFLGIAVGLIIKRRIKKITPSKQQRWRWWILMCSAWLMSAGCLAIGKSHTAQSSADSGQDIVPQEAAPAPQSGVGRFLSHLKAGIASHGDVKIELDANGNPVPMHPAIVDDGYDARSLAHQNPGLVVAFDRSHLAISGDHTNEPPEGFICSLNQYLHNTDCETEAAHRQEDAQNKAYQAYAAKVQAEQDKEVAQRAAETEASNQKAYAEARAKLLSIYQSAPKDDDKIDILLGVYTDNQNLNRSDKFKTHDGKVMENIAQLDDDKPDPSLPYRIGDFVTVKTPAGKEHIYAVFAVEYCYDGAGDCRGPDGKSMSLDQVASKLPPVRNADLLYAYCEVHLICEINDQVIGRATPEGWAWAQSVKKNASDTYQTAGKGGGDLGTSPQ